MTLRKRLDRLEGKRGADGNEPAVIFLCAAWCEGAAEGDAYHEGGDLLSSKEAAIVILPTRTLWLARAADETEAEFSLRAEVSLTSARQTGR